MAQQSQLSLIDSTEHPISTVTTETRANSSWHRTGLESESNPTPIQRRPLRSIHQHLKYRCLLSKPRLRGWHQFLVSVRLGVHRENRVDRLVILFIGTDLADPQPIELVQQDLATEGGSHHTSSTRKYIFCRQCCVRRSIDSLTEDNS